MSVVRGDTYAALSHIKAGTSVTGEYDYAFSDTVDIDLAGLGIALPLRAWAVFTAGTIKVTTVGGKTDTYADGELIKGLFYPEALKRIWSTGTSVTIVRLYY